MYCNTNSFRVYFNDHRDVYFIRVNQSFIQIYTYTHKHIYSFRTSVDHNNDILLYGEEIYLQTNTLADIYIEKQNKKIKTVNNTK